METAGDGGGLVGSMEMAESMLKGFLPDERVSDIMNEIQGPLVGRNIWELRRAIRRG